MLERLRILIQNRNSSTEVPDEGDHSNSNRVPSFSLSNLSQGRQGVEVSRTQTRGAEKASPRPRKFHFCRTSRENSLEDGEKVRMFWSCCSNCKISPQASKPPAQKQEPRLGSITQSKQIYQSTGLSIATNSMDSTASETGVSSADTLDSTCQSLLSVESERTSIFNMEAIINLMEYAHCNNKVFASILLLKEAARRHFNNVKLQFLDKHDENISFLRAVSSCCVTAEKSGLDTLDLPYTKNQLTEALVMVMETLPSHSVPSFILSCSMLAVYNLSKIKPPLDSELETGILRLALHGVFSMETQMGDPHSMALYRSSSDTMDIMLKGLLSESPTTSHLLFMLEHINFWIRSQDLQERYRAIKCSVSLLRYAIQQPKFEKSGELPALGHHVAHFAVCITDAVEDVSYQAREAITYLYQLLLNQMGLSAKEAGHLWRQESEDKKMLAYLDVCRVGELFRKIFTEDQKRAFLQTSLLAIYDPLMRISQAGILLVYSLLGKAAELMHETAEGMEKEIYKQLHKLRILREVPEVLQSLFPN